MISRNLESELDSGSYTPNTGELHINRTEVRVHQWEASGSSRTSSICRVHELDVERFDRWVRR